MLEKIRLRLHDLGLSTIVLDMTSKAQATTTTKYTSWTSPKLKNICVLNDTVKKVKTQFIKWEENISNSYTG